MACEKFLVSFLARFSTPSVSPPQRGGEAGAARVPARNDIEVLICRLYIMNPIAYQRLPLMCRY